MTVYLINERVGDKTPYQDRAAAEEQREKLIELGMKPENLALQPENKDTETEDTDTRTGEEEPAEPDEEQTPEVDPEVDTDMDHTTVEVEPEPEEELPDNPPGVDTDPLDWVPSDFVDRIDGQPAINRKGYDVLAHHYDISVKTELLVSPTETEYEYAEVRAIAETEDGVEYVAHGSAHVSRGDDHYLLVEMADTRAAKRATARATGVGMVAVEELQNEL
jgi:hypothetical protein